MHRKLRLSTSKAVVCTLSDNCPAIWNINLILSYLPDPIVQLRMEYNNGIQSGYPYPEHV